MKQVSKGQLGSLGCRDEEIYWFWYEGPEVREWALNFIIQNVCVVSFLCKEGTGNLFKVCCDGSWKERGILKGVGRIHAECVTLKLKWRKQTLLGTYLVLQPLARDLRSHIPLGNWAWAPLVPQLRPDKAKKKKNLWCCVVQYSNQLINSQLAT